MANQFDAGTMTGKKMPKFLLPYLDPQKERIASVDDAIFSATFRCGDNDNDPLGYYEYGVGAATGGQICWGWNFYNDPPTLCCEDIPIVLSLTGSGSAQSISFKCGEEYEVVDDETQWSQITEAWVMASVSDPTGGLKITVTDYTGQPGTFAGAIAQAGATITPGQCGTTSLTKPVPVVRMTDIQPIFQGQNYGPTANITFNASVSMKGSDTFTRNAVVGRLIIVGSSPTIAAQASHPVMEIPDTVIPPKYRQKGKYRHGHRHWFHC